jgi:hypothetical protein
MEKNVFSKYIHLSSTCHVFSFLSGKVSVGQSLEFVKWNSVL